VAGLVNRRLAAGLAVLSLGSAACRRGPAASGDPYADAVQRAIPGVEKGVGLTFRTPPKYASRTREQVRAFVVAQFEKPDELAKLAGRTAAYKRLGLLPDTLDARRMFEALLAEQIAGLYDPKTKTFYFVADGEPAAVGIVASHELVHALQDQYLNIDSLDASTADDDHLAAAHALIEGQATLNMVGGQGFAAMLGSGWDKVRDAIREQRAAAPVFSSAPAAVQEELLFPYLNGADFMRRAREHAPTANLLNHLPQSTEQVLHDAAFFGTRDVPTVVTLPPIPGATVTFQNTLGEFSTRLFLFQQSRNVADAARAAAGWDGDRYAVVRTSAGEGLVWVSVWDSERDASEFLTAAASAVATRYAIGDPFARVDTTSPRPTSWSVSPAGRTVTATQLVVDGRPTVIYQDVPGAAPLAIAASALALRESAAR
jgi:hypothetical protein